MQGRTKPRCGCRGTQGWDFPIMHPGSDCSIPYPEPQRGEYPHRASPIPRARSAGAGTPCLWDSLSLPQHIRTRQFIYLNHTLRGPDLLLRWIAAALHWSDLPGRVCLGFVFHGGRGVILRRRRGAGRVGEGTNKWVWESHSAKREASQSKAHQRDKVQLGRTAGR